MVNIELRVFVARRTSRLSVDRGQLLIEIRTENIRTTSGDTDEPMNEGCNISDIYA